MKLSSNFLTLLMLLIFLSSYALFSQSSRVINTSLPVGYTNGDPGVTSTGAASYSIPLWVSPGTNGMQPNLFVNYNSQSGDGLLGHGWNLAGISAITRSVNNVFLNDTAISIKFSVTDRLNWNGQYLEATLGNYGDNGTVYHTHVESFATITSYGSSGSGPSWFKVQLKNGTFMEYGNTPDSKIEAQGRTEVLNWYLNKVTDANGNYMSYTYTENGTTGESRPSLIEYTGNTGLTPYAKVEFTYDIRIDPQTSYICGSKTLNGSILKGIKSYYNSTISHEYIFNYSNIDGTTKLVEIIEKGSTGEQFNSTLIDWNALNYSVESYSVPKPSIITPQYYYYGDFNGDGRDDFFSLPQNPTTYPGPPNLITNYSGLADGTGFSGGSMVINEVLNGNYCIGDINGDGKDEVLVKKKLSETSYQLSTTMLGSTIANAILNLTTDFTPTMGDFDGDGIAEILIKIGASSTKLYKYIKNTDGTEYFTLQSTLNSTLSGYISKVNEKYIDINNDGRTDLMIVDSSGTRFYNIDNGAFNLILSSASKPVSPFFLGDFNGDGLSDMVERLSNNQLKFYICNGTNFIEKTIAIANLPVNSVFKIGDFNDDNRTDLFFCSAASGVSYFHFCFSTGDGITSLTTLATPTFATPSSDLISILDANGDGIDDVLNIVGYGTSSITAFMLHKTFTGNLVSAVTDGLNNKVSFAYSSMSDNQTYTSGTGAVAPLQEFRGPMKFVKTLSLPDGVNGSNTIKYTYSNGKYLLGGPGFLGFMSTTEENLNTGIKTVNAYNFDNTNYYVYSSGQTRYNSSSTAFYQSSQGLGFIELSPSTGRFFPYISASSSTNLLTNSSKNITININSLGDIYNQVQSVGDNITQTIYDGHNSYGSPSLITVKTNKAIDNPNTWITRVKSLEYNPNGSVKKIIFDPGKAKAVTTETTYDVFGNKLTETISASGIETRTSSLQYDLKGRFLTKQTNPVGHVTEWTLFDEALGVVTKVKDLNGLETSSSYDGFGRLTGVTTPDGKSISYNRFWSINTPANALYYSQVSSSGEPTVKTYSDCLGRAIYEEKTGFSGAMVVTETNYNNKGQLVQKSEPYFAGGTARWTNYLYDINGRMDRITAPSSIMSYSYNDKTTTITNLSTNQSTSQTLDASGLLASSTDASGGSVIYKYNSFFKVKSTTPNGLATTMEYDEYGYQTKLTDPDAGVITYEYNALGDLTSQTDARGNTYNNTYDKIGRLLSKTCAGQTTSYIYDNKTKGIGSLGSILSHGNISTEYVYDSDSRCQSETQNIDGASYATTYGYSNGKISSLTYPSGFAINYLYNTNGYLSEVKRSDNNTTIWQAEQINALGQIEQQMNGNNLRTTKTYDTNHFLTSIVTGTVQNLEYGFDPATGNLTYRKDLKRNLTEDFTYDNLDRLKTATVQGQLPVVLNYASSGNILDKTEIGTYNYQLPQPHALSKISDSNGAIPAVPQTISYNTFNKVSLIIEDTKSALFTYGHDEERRKMEMLTGSTVTLTRYYIGLYEREVSPGEIRELHYIPTGDGCTAIYEKFGTGATQMFYLHSDHQGSVQTITNQSGANVEELSFDAWGRRRNVSNWSYSSVPTTFIFSRGYTGHEHLDQFNLINMNGRLYDPQLGRMLSVDRFVQDPFNTQSYNRYSYCMNNPLKYTDPSGWAGEGGIGTYLPWWAYPYRPYGYGITPADRAFWHSTDMTNEAGINASKPGAQGYLEETKAFAGVGNDLIYKGSTYKWVSTDAATSSYGVDWTFYTGAGLTIAQKTLFSSEFGTWMGKDGKIRPQSWSGNGTTGGKYKFAKSWSGKLGLLGKSVAVYSMYSSLEKWQNGKISNELFGGDMVSGLAGIFGGIYGASWSFGWELGKNYGPSTWHSSKPQESVILEYMHEHGILEP